MYDSDSDSDPCHRRDASVATDAGPITDAQVDASVGQDAIVGQDAAPPPPPTRAQRTPDPQTPNRPTPSPLTPSPLTPTLRTWSLWTQARPTPVHRRGLERRHRLVRARGGNLDGEGLPEIVMGPQVFDADGNLLGTATSIFSVRVPSTASRRSPRSRTSTSTAGPKSSPGLLPTASSTARSSESGPGPTDRRVIWWVPTWSLVGTSRTIARPSIVMPAGGWPTKE
ncbi:MAG: hypothetical protein HY791_33615 [Deltaproteobacteria bacterium]|nr:hypothetical protein [Deltaproteobacteria bacterium]